MTRDPHHPLDEGQRDDASMRVLERACDAALFGEMPSAQDALDARAFGFDLAREIESFERVTAQLEAEHHAANPSSAPKVPAALRDRLHALADAHGAPSPIPISRGAPAARRTRSALRDWIVAAACIAFGAVSTFLVVRVGSEGGSELPADPAQFVSLHPNAVRCPWEGTKDERIVGEVRGEAIFDPQSSKGVLVIEGLASNDPSAEQYQLWIFDAKRDERYPVDGGVFDMPACGRAVIPIEAKLSVEQPTLFAVTIERPGGVVVSDRRIALIAKP